MADRSRRSDAGNWRDCGHAADDRRGDRHPGPLGGVHRRRTSRCTRSSPPPSSLRFATRVLGVLWGELVSRTEAMRSWAELDELIHMVRVAPSIIERLRARPAVASIRPFGVADSSLSRSSSPSLAANRVSLFFFFFFFFVGVYEPLFW